MLREPWPHILNDSRSRIPTIACFGVPQTNCSFFVETPPTWAVHFWRHLLEGKIIETSLDHWLLVLELRGLLMFSSISSHLSCTYLYCVLDFRRNARVWAKVEHAIVRIRHAATLRDSPANYTKVAVLSVLFTYAVRERRKHALVERWSRIEEDWNVPSDTWSPHELLTRARRSERRYLWGRSKFLEFMTDLTKILTAEINFKVSTKIQEYLAKPCEESARAAKSYSSRTGCRAQNLYFYLPLNRIPV